MKLKKEETITQKDLEEKKQKKKKHEPTWVNSPNPQVMS
jgi:hypothetical protein